MSSANKNKIFEIFVFQLIKWYNSCTSTQANLESFTKLKLQKLLFLLSASTATIQNKKLLNIFDNFYAMPYGPVESDIYNAMIHNSFEHISFVNGYIKITKGLTIDSFSYETELIQEAISFIKNENPKLILYTAAQLVEITHKWTSWKYTFDIANLRKKGSEKMDISSICNDCKIYE